MDLEVKAPRRLSLDFGFVRSVGVQVRLSVQVGGDRCEIPYCTTAAYWNGNLIAYVRMSQVSRNIQK